MLHLILGSAGTGKTTQLYQEIQETVDGGGRCILLVPEQASFENEKLLYRKLGAKNVLSVEVLSFTRLCDHVFRTYGGLAGIHMDDTARQLLMSVALESLQDSLKVYKKNAGSAPFVESVCSMVHELKTAGVTGEQLRAAADLQETEESRDKFYDIALIYDTFQAIVQQGYNDPDDHLERAAQLLEGTDYFAGCHVYVDGFVAFLGAEWKLLRQILSCGGDLTVALCCEDGNMHGSSGAFAAASATARRLTDLAKKCGSQVSLPVKCCKAYRFTADGLAHFTAEFPRLRPNRLSDFSGAKQLSCENPDDEIEAVASQIADLVRQGYRYRDIAVIARDLERYEVTLETVFSRYGIPYFSDSSVDVQVNPLIRGILCALDAAQSRFESENILSFAKSGLLTIDSISIGLLENYCYTWGINRDAWREDFQNHPDGMKEQFSGEAQARLERINQTRAFLMDGLLFLEKGLKDCSGELFAKTVYDYLLRIDAPQAMNTMAEHMPSAEAKRFMEDSVQIWDALMGILDIFGGALGKLRFSSYRFIQLFRLAVGSLKIGTVPQTLDQVLVGTADRIRPNAPRAVFVIGLNEGVFPRWAGSGGLLSNQERESLKEDGVDLLHTANRQAQLEAYYVYFAVTQPSEKLFLSFPRQDVAGHGLAPSAVVAQAEKICGKTLTAFSDSLSALDRLNGEKTAFDLMARGWRENTPEQAALRHWFHQNRPERLMILEGMAAFKPYRLETKEGQSLFEGDLHLSPSRLERYFNCPFSFFCETGMDLHPRRRAEFNPMESGTMIHLVLQQMMKRYGGKGLAELDDTKLREESAGFIVEALHKKISDLEAMPKRFLYLFERQVDVLVRLLRHLGQEFLQSKYETVGMELPIRENGACQPLRLQTGDGSRILVEGVVDRVDALQDEKKRYLRVVDYKTGVKKFDLSEICHGLDMQMLIYLFALCDSFGGDALENIPAGVLYMPARNDVVDAQRSLEADKLAAMRDAQLKMNGLLLEDLKSLEAMEAELHGRFIPAKKDKEGLLDRKKSDLVTYRQMRAVRDGVEMRLKGMAEKLKSGQIEALPVLKPEQRDGRTVCAYCEFAFICGHEQDDPVKELAKLDKEAALRELGCEAGEGKEEGQDAGKEMDATAKKRD